MTCHSDQSQARRERSQGIYLVILHALPLSESVICCSALLVAESHRRVRVACRSSDNLHVARLCSRVEHAEFGFSGLLSGRTALSPGLPSRSGLRLDLIQRQKDHAGIESPLVAFALLTPFSLLPVLPFSSLPPLLAKRGWLMLNLALLGLTAYLLRRMSPLSGRRVALSWYFSPSNLAAGKLSFGSRAYFAALPVYGRRLALFRRTDRLRRD